MAPRDIEPGAAWPEAIVRAVADGLLMITVVSRDAYRSRQMARELERTDNEGVPILPIRVDGAALAILPREQAVARSRTAVCSLSRSQRRRRWGSCSSRRSSERFAPRTRSALRQP
jgi:TIR domain